jgi:hypothetical protein
VGERGWVILTSFLPVVYSPYQTNTNMNNRRFIIYAAFFAAFLLLGPARALAAPVVGLVSYSSSIEAGKATTLSASVSSAVPIQSCNLYVDNVDKGSMTVSGNSASKSYTFPYSQVYTVFVFCRDTSGGLGKGQSVGIWVKVGPAPPESEPFEGSGSESEGEEEALPEEQTEEQPPETGSLIKLECPEDSEADHPCRAVYYYGSDGKRHAFPNANVYFTWYENFDSVVTVSSETMGSFMLGANVTYRPGVKMVKFATVNRVYAVSKGGVLHWIATEDVASALYGEDWNTKIDDIPDAFYSNYTFGAGIASADSYAVQAEIDAAPTVGDSL